MTDQSVPVETEYTSAAPPAPAAWRRWLWALAPGLVVLGGLGWGAAMVLANVIDDDTAFAVKAAEGESRAVAMAAGLVFREIETHKWVANDPFFQPGWALDNMPAFQQGIVAAIARFTADLNELAARAGGGSDVNLDRAAGFLKYPGNVWMFDISTSWAPTASSEKQYRSAARNLVLFNERVAAGDAPFERSPQALALLLARLGADLDQAAARLDAHLAEDRLALFDIKADDLFYATKGRVYGHAMVLAELGGDFAPVLERKDLGAAWSAALDSLRHAARLNPAVVLSASADATLLPSHLAAQGFHLLRARVQLAAIAARLEH